MSNPKVKFPIDLEKQKAWKFSFARQRLLQMDEKSFGSRQLDSYESGFRGNPEVYHSLMSELRKNQSRVIFSEFSGFCKRGKRDVAKWRTLDEHFILFPIHGVCGVKFDDDHPPIRIHAEELFYLPPGIKHCLQTFEPQSFPVMYRFRFRFEKPFKNKPQNPAFFIAPKAKIHPLHIETLYKEFILDRPGREYRAMGLLLFLLGSHYRFFTGQKMASPKKRASRILTWEQCMSLKVYVETRSAGGILPRDMASHLSLSQKHFARLFQNTFEMTARDWIIHKRISLAAVVLRKADKNITEVAEQLGYKDVFAFSRQFKKVMGHSPRIFRKLR